MALFCGRRSLKEVGDREKFLLQNIEKGPVPLAYLVWLFPEPTGCKPRYTELLGACLFFLI